MRRCAAAVFLDMADNLANGDVGAFLHRNRKPPAYVCGQILACLLGIDDNNVFAFADYITVFFQPLCEGSFTDRFTDRWDFDFMRHSSSPRVNTETPSTSSGANGPGCSE